MDSTEGYKELLKQRLTAKRYIHTIGVAQTASKLAAMYKGNVEQAYLAGLLHDYAKDLPTTELLSIAQENDLITDRVEMITPLLLHGTVGAYLLERDGLLTDQEVLAAIRCHTTGCVGMSKLDKIIYIADYIEPGRTFPGVDEIRTMSYKNLDLGILAGFNHTIAFLLQSGAFIHPLSIAARNYLLEEINIKNCN